MPVTPDGFGSSERACVQERLSRGLEDVNSGLGGGHGVASQHLRDEKDGESERFVW